MTPFIKRIDRPKRGIFLGSLPIIWQVIFFYLPIAFTIMRGFFIKVLSGSGIRFTWENFRFVLSMVHFTVIGKSILLATATTIFTFLIAYPLAHILTFYVKKYRSLLLFFVIIPFWTNFLLHVYAWFFVLEKKGAINTILTHFRLISSPLHLLNSHYAILVMMIYCYLPFMLLPIFSSLQRVDYRLIEASTDLGASWGTTIRRVILPLTLSGIRAGCFLVFIPAFGEFIIPEMMGGDKYYFVGNVMSQYMLGQETTGIGAAFMAMSAIALLLTASCLHYTLKKIEGKLI